MADPAPRFPGRASLQRYDRPAPVYSVLMAAPLHDFPFVGCWTVLGRAPTEDEWRSALSIEDNEQSRLLWIEALFGKSASPTLRLPPEVAQRLAHYRLTSTLFGRLMLDALAILRRWPVWRLIERIGRRIAGLTRYTYRHSRKWLIRLWKRVLSSVQRSSHEASEDLVADLCAEEREIFERLLEACRQSADRTNANHR